MTRSAVLSRNSLEVTSPIASSGSMTAPFNRKCLSHVLSRGLNKGANPPKAAMEAMFAPLYRLQTIHANAKLLSTVSPPCCLLMTWSTS